MSEDSHGAWQAQVAELERMAAEEHARYVAAHPGYGFCPAHPERPSVRVGVINKRGCAECVEQAQRAYLDAAMKADAPWPASYDMRDYSDAPRASQGFAYKETK
jgi:hypothetical protein